MRLRTTDPTAQRVWTVELRPGSDGPQMVCQQCGHTGTVFEASTARAAVLKHLVKHARRDALPSYTRICQCHERGCRWHPRHRGCAGPVRLLLARERSGRLWRLADACTACASVTEQAAVVPEAVPPTAMEPSDSEMSRRRKRRPRGPGHQVRVHEMLSYLAAALPSDTGAAARLLAVQCALRMDSKGRVRLPAGVMRSLRLQRDPHAWSELEQSLWLRRTPSATGVADGVVTAQLFDAALFAQSPARPDRRSAADWALRVANGRSTAVGDHSLRLTVLCLAAHTDFSTGLGCAEVERVARECGLLHTAFLAVLDRATRCIAWRLACGSEDLYWELLPKGIGSGS